MGSVLFVILAALNAFGTDEFVLERVSKNALYIQPIMPIIGAVADYSSMYYVTYEREFWGDKSINIEPVYVGGHIAGQQYDLYTEPNIKTSGFGAATSFKWYSHDEEATGFFIGPKFQGLTVKYTMPAYVRGQPYFNIQVAGKTASERDFDALIMIGYRAKWKYFTFYFDAGAGVGTDNISGDQTVFDQTYLDESKSALRIDGDFGIGVPF
jgi:hypothetical protein